MICGKCKEDHASVAEVRQCYGALPDAPVDYNEYDTDTGQEASIEERGENFFLTNVNQNLYDLRKEEETWEQTMERQQREVHEDRMRDLRGDHPGHSNYRPPSSTPGKRVYLNCPYAERNDAKALGAKWDAAKRQWWVDEPTFKAREALFNRWVDGPYVKGPASSPKGTMEPPKQLVEDGWYWWAGTVAKVVHNQAGTNQYALLLKVPEGATKGNWVYSPGIHQKLLPDMALTEEQAAEFGKLYGVCGICGRELSNPESIERGIGPVCFSKMGW